MTLLYRKGYYFERPWKAIPAQISYSWWSLRRGVQNFWRYRRAIYHDAAWDWSGLMAIMEVKFRLMAELHTKHGITADADRIARECTIAAVLCRRIGGDDYALQFESSNWNPPLGPWVHGGRELTRKGKWQWYSEYMIKQDLDMLARLMQRRLRCWWN